MEPAVGKRLWSYVRAALFMARNGKRKLLLSMHLLGANTKRRAAGTKAVTRAVANLLSHHGHYEFSCTNSPAAAASSSSSSSSRRRLAYFPCLGAVAEDEYDGYGRSLSLPAGEPPLAAAASSSSSSSSPALLLPGAASGEFSVRVSNYSSEDEAGGAGSDAVDADAEEFIRRFYDQLSRQNTAVALLPYYMQQETIAAA